MPKVTGGMVFYNTEELAQIMGFKESEVGRYFGKDGIYFKGKKAKTKVKSYMRELKRIKQEEFPPWTW